MKAVRLTVLADNYVTARNLRGEHGLAFHLAADNRQILFDTGQGLVLADNARLTVRADELGLDAEQMAHALAFSWLENQVQAALRAVPLGQSAGQRLLAALAPDIPAAVAQARNLQHRMDDWQSFSPLLAILSSQHEVQYSRLFRS